MTADAVDEMFVCENHKKVPEIMLMPLTCNFSDVKFQQNDAPFIKSLQCAGLKNITMHCWTGKLSLQILIQSSTFGA